MVHALEPYAAHDGNKHANRLYDVRNLFFAAKIRHDRTEQVVQSENVYHIKVVEARAAIAFDGGIPGERAITQPAVEVDGLHRAFGEPPAKGRAFRADFGG